MSWIRRFRPRTQEAEHPGSPDADVAPTRVVTATAGDRPRVSALPVTVTTPAAAPVPISGPVPVSVPASLPTSGAEVKSPTTAQPEVKLAEPVRPVPPVEPPKTATTPQPQAPVPVVTTSGRDAYFRPGGYSPDDRQHAKATPTAAHPVMGGPSLLSLGLPWDELTLTAFAANSSEPSPEHRQAVTDLAGALVQILKIYPDSFVTVVGHADPAEASVGTLSQHRAEAVFTALLALDVPERVMHAASLGSDMPVVQAPGHEAHNRRVVVRVIKRNFQAEHRAPWIEPRSMPSSGLPKIPAPPVAPPAVPLLPLQPDKAPSGAEAGQRMGETGKKADAICTQEHEQAERSGGRSLTQQLEKLVEEELTRLGLPESLRGRVSDLALIALDKGVAAAVDVLSKDTQIDDKTREGIRTILKGVMRLK